MGQRTYSDVQSDGTILAWEVERLWEITRNYTVRRVPLSEISDFDLVCWFDGERHVPSCRAVAEHARKIMEAEFEHPVILSARGHVMDGMHRVAKAWLLGRDYVYAVQFDEDPEPDERLPQQDAVMTTGAAEMSAEESLSEAWLRPKIL